MNKIDQFFLFCSGAYLPLIKEAPSEKNKYVGIGASIFFTALFATIAMGFALASSFDQLVWVILLSLFWGLMIFNLDRYIISSIKKEKDTRRNLYRAIPRLLLATMISIVIAKPLELKLFEQEIADELVRARNVEKVQLVDSINSKLEHSIEKLNKEAQSLNDNLEVYQNRRDQLRTIAQEEADGTGGSKQRNLGPIYELKNKGLIQAQNELEAYRLQVINEVNNIDQAKDSLRTSAQLAIVKLYLPQSEGIAAQLHALNSLSTRSNTIWWAVFFINLLFVIVECTPIILKTITPYGPFDVLLQRKEQEYLNDEKLDEEKGSL